MAGIVLTIEELRPNISSNFSDSRKNPIERNLHEAADVCVQPSREACHVRHAAGARPFVRVTIQISRERRGFEICSAGNIEAGLVTNQSPMP
jgi:hypothetical protein